MVVKIYVACHKPIHVPKHPLLVPIQVGAALCKDRFAGMIYDDTGDNISHLNRSYCELTAQYWAWKNDNADYYGFFHYRRYLSFKIKDKMRPYVLANHPGEKLLGKYGYDTFHIQGLIGGYDILVPIAEDMGTSLFEHYKQAAYHHIEDLQLAAEVLGELFPDFMPYYHKYIHGSMMHPCNIYIMKRELFHEYCSWLFAILTEYDKRKGATNYTGEEARVNGYLSERLFGVYYTWLKDTGKVKALELQRIDFMLDSMKYFKRKVKYLIVPPNSRRTSLARKLREQLRK